MKIAETSKKVINDFSLLSLGGTKAKEIIINNNIAITFIEIKAIFFRVRYIFTP